MAFYTDRQRLDSLTTVWNGCALRVRRSWQFRAATSTGRDDPRTMRLIAALPSRGLYQPQRFVYIRTSVSTGDCAGARVTRRRARQGAVAARTPAASRPKIGSEDGPRAMAYGFILLAPVILRRRAACHWTDSSRFAPRCFAPRRRCVPPTISIPLSRRQATAAAPFSASSPTRGTTSRRCRIKLGAVRPVRTRSTVAAKPAAPRNLLGRGGSARAQPMMLSFMSESRRLTIPRMKRGPRFCGGNLKYPARHVAGAEFWRPGTQEAVGDAIVDDPTTRTAPALTTTIVARPGRLPSADEREKKKPRQSYRHTASAVAHAQLTVAWLVGTPSWSSSALRALKRF